MKSHNSIITRMAIENPTALRLSFGLLIAGTILSGIKPTQQAFDDLFKTTAADRYNHNYTGTGECLDNTPFDPANGAQLLERDFYEADRLTVIPDNANLNKPSVLSFAVQGESFVALDKPTAVYMTQQGCEIAADGHQKL